MPGGPLPLCADFLNSVGPIGRITVTGDRRCKVYRIELPMRFVYLVYPSIRWFGDGRSCGFALDWADQIESTEKS
jgi:hypothetical protein